MARKKKINEGMKHVGDMILNRDRARAEIKDRMALELEEQLRLHTLKIYEAMFKDFPDAGDSEISNSTGVSRNTVYLWRRDYYNNYLGEGRPKKSAVDQVGVHSEVVPEYEFTKQVWEGLDRLVFRFSGKQLHVITYDAVAYATSAEEADELEMKNRQNGTPDERPEWLTDDVLRDAAKKADVRLALAPWS